MNKLKKLKGPASLSQGGQYQALLEEFICAALQAYYYEGIRWDKEAIAEYFGKSEEEIGIIIRRARKKIKSIMQEVKNNQNQKGGKNENNKQML